MTKQEYERAGNLLLSIQRGEELIEALSESEKYENEYHITVNGLHTMVDKRLMDKIKDSLEEEIKLLRVEFKNL